MTVSTIGSVAEFVTNGVTTNYPFYFKFLANEDLVVTYVNPLGVSATLTFGTHYTVNGAGNDQGGSIVTTTALAGPGQLIVSREMDLFQQTSLRNQGKFLAETHEDVFDRLTMLIQQGFAIFVRALTRPFGRDYFFAENRRIASVADPVDEQDAATKSSVEAYVASVLATGQGPINNAANIVFIGADGLLHSLQEASDINDPKKGAAIFGRAVRTIKSVIELQATAGSYAGEQVWLQQYRESNPLVGGGPAIWRLGVKVGDLGKTFNVTGNASGYWERPTVGNGVFHAMEYGAIGNAYLRDETNNTYWVDDAKTIPASDDTDAITRLFAAANAIASTRGGQVIDLGKGRHFVTTTPTVNKSYVVVVNGRLNQKTKAAHAITFTGPSMMMYNGMIGVSLGHCYSTADAGNLVDVGFQGLGQFTWDARREISEGGRYGMRTRGNCFMITLDAPWFNDTYGSAFYMPASGDTIVQSQLGGSTTMTMVRPYATNVRTAEPAFDIGCGWDGVTLTSPAADHITCFGRFRVNGFKVNGTAYSENVRNPVSGSMPVDHRFVEINNATGFSIDGFYFSVAAGFVPASGIKSFIDADFVNGRVSMLRGALPAGYAPVRTQGGCVEVFGEFFPGTSLANCIRLFGGRIILPTKSLISGTYAGTGTVVLFTIPDAEAHVYEITKTYAFSGIFVSDTWLVSSGAGKKVVTRLQTGPDYSNIITVDVNGSNQVVMGNTGGATLAGPWISREITP